MEQARWKFEGFFRQPPQQSVQLSRATASNNVLTNKSVIKTEQPDTKHTVPESLNSSPRPGSSSSVSSSSSSTSYSSKNSFLGSSEIRLPIKDEYKQQTKTLPKKRRRRRSSVTSNSDKKVSALNLTEMMSQANLKKMLKLVTSDDTVSPAITSFSMENILKNHQFHK